MNERIKELMNQAGTDTSGKWMGVEHAKKFAELVINECCDRMSKETIRHDGYGYNQHALYQILRKHFGVNE